MDLGRIILRGRDARAVHLTTGYGTSRLLATAVALAMVFATFAVRALPAHAAPPPASGADFNGDGFADLAIGTPMQDFSQIQDPGGVSVLYGTATGLDATTGIGDQWLTQNSTGMQGDGAEAGDQMGLAVAVGDFNGDGFTDLAAGAPGEDVGSKVDAGAVNVIYGSAAGLDPAGSPGSQFWTLDNASVPGTAAAPRDAFGRSLAVGDFNGDGFADLAAGAPSRNVNHIKDDGTVLVLYGSASGLAATNSQLWSRSTGIPGIEHPGDQLAWSMSAGDFDGDGNSDLAMGNPFDDVGAMTDAGTAAVLYGSASGLTASNSQLLSQDTPGVPGNAEANDIFGWDVAAGAYDGSLKDGLAVGAPLEAVKDLGAIGVVNVFPGSASGLTGTGSQLLSQNATGVPGAAKDGDAFGASLAAGNFGSGGATDLAVGVAADTIKRLPAAGSVNVFYGSVSGLSLAGSQLWDQETSGILDAAEPGDLMGADVATGDYNGDGHDDLAAAVTYEDLGPLIDAGAVNVIYADSGPNGLMAAGNQFWTQDDPGMHNKARSDDQFAYSLA